MPSEPTETESHDFEVALIPGSITYVRVRGTPTREQVLQALTAGWTITPDAWGVGVTEGGDRFYRAMRTRPLMPNEPTEAHKEMLRALKCLYLEVDEDIAENVERAVMARVAELERMNEALLEQTRSL